MSQKRHGGLGLPNYAASEEQKRWVEQKLRTAQFIRTLWNVANKFQRRDPGFLCALVQCGWTNVRRNAKDREPTRLWRNLKMAEYLHAPYESDEQLAIVLSKSFPRLSRKGALALLKTQTGITHYYTAFRPATLKFIKRNSETVRLAFERVAATNSQLEKKISGAAALVQKLGKFKAAKRWVHAFNGLTPVLACLDPQRRFPIMNDRTRSLLSAIRENADRQGMAKLSNLIGTHGVKNSFELDAYAYGEDFSKIRKTSGKIFVKTDFKDVGLKSEINSMANLAAKRSIITKRHNALMNRLEKALLWHQMIAKEYRFDALVENWKEGRHLLIEAKTASEGPTGRTQIRQAIGQLYDYRHTHFPGQKLDLAILLLKEPKQDVTRLLKSLHIEVLWFEGKKIKGTIHLAREN
ncbi:MAG: hypothetical protein JWN63_606 [Candidatus Acidoferrum typicum]|nr:hypothetical protein [Candidatus Acidoferrum typicum]